MLVQTTSCSSQPADFDYNICQPTTSDQSLSMLCNPRPGRIAVVQCHGPETGSPKWPEFSLVAVPRFSGKRGRGGHRWPTGHLQTMLENTCHPMHQMAPVEIRLRLLSLRIKKFQYIKKFSYTYFKDQICIYFLLFI